jgi:hypothetical protein
MLINTELERFFPRHPSVMWQAPIWCITPQIDRCIHRFYDTSPVSPSGRYVALTRLPYEDKLPTPGDAAEIVIVDLQQGTTQIVAETRGWDSQLGAQAQWGADDQSLFFNDVDTLTWKPFGVRLDPTTGARKNLDGPIFMVSPDGKLAASPCLLRTARTQAGYGVVVPENHVPKNSAIAADDGIYLTDTETGACRLLISFAEIVERAKPAFDPEDFKSGSLYGFHVKWNPQGNRLLFVMRCQPHRGRLLRNVITMKPDGSEVAVALHWRVWSRGGHHPNWCPDGKRILMNLKADGATMRFVRFDYEGTNIEVEENFIGSGHPTLHPNGRIIVTDAYLGESAAAEHGKVPLRCMHIPTNSETVLVWVDARSTHDRLHALRVDPRSTHDRFHALRVDPHPAWDREYRMIVFNGYSEGTRRVFLCDMRNLL